MCLVSFNGSWSERVGVPLKYVICGAPANSKLCRWSIYLNRFDITVYHRPGHLNVIADYYSRAPMKED